ncbi:MAG: transposase [Candidatus Omnitrophota bacterium]
MRKNVLKNNHVYHVFSRSIFKFKIFNDLVDFDRMRNLFWYYRKEKPILKYSYFLQVNNKEKFYKDYLLNNKEIVNIIAYCIMPTHIHLILKQTKDKGISIFMNNILNSYTRYFNSKIKRKGPLWESRFKSVNVDTDEQLMHLTRYVHLNPVTAHLVNNPEAWNYSSYKEFISMENEEQPICKYNDLLDINPKQYAEFVHSNIDYQRQLADIKDKLFD